MPTKKKDNGVEAGVEIRTSASRLADRYQDGVFVHTDAPAQTAGANDGQSAGSKKEKN